MVKITKTQFENWSKDFKKNLDSYLRSNESKLIPEEQVQFFSLTSHITRGVEAQIPLAVMSFITVYENFPGHDLIKNEVYSDTDGLTFQQWLDNIKQKLKEHAEANGYYKSSEPVDKMALRQSWKNFWKLTEEMGWGNKLKPYLSEESSELIIKSKVFLESFQEIVEISDDLSDIKENSGMLNEYPFLMKDLIGRVEKSPRKIRTIQAK